MQESAEMYLETIYILLKEKGCVRSVDISEYMEYSRASVSRAMKRLMNGGYISVDQNGYITLTEAGTTIAEQIYDRRILLIEILKKLGVRDEIAKVDACKIEHGVSMETFFALRAHYDRHKDTDPESN